jgi:hypothetical protein
MRPLAAIRSATSVNAALIGVPDVRRDAVRLLDRPAQHWRNMSSVAVLTSISLTAAVTPGSSNLWSLAPENAEVTCQRSTTRFLQALGLTSPP